jgi:hypothetical protein
LRFADGRFYVAHVSPRTRQITAVEALRWARETGLAEQIRTTVAAWPVSSPRTLECVASLLGLIVRDDPVIPDQRQKPTSLPPVAGRRCVADQE